MSAAPSPTSAASPKRAVGPIRVADGLGAASAALGAPMLFAPRRLLRAIGVRDDAQAVATVMGVGAREFLATVTILGMRHRRVGAWSRVGGDTIDLTLLGIAWRNRRCDATKLLGAIAAVTGILAADLYTAIQLNRAEGTHLRDGADSHGVGVQHETGGSPARVRTAITVGASLDEVRSAFLAFEWSAFDPAALHDAGELRFAPAPGDRGTEVHLDYDPSVPGGSVGALALKLTGQAPDQKINDELRRFKALVETGVEVRSEKSPEGPSALRQMVQRPAQPVGGRT
jgi:hypothetical protein